MYRALVPYMRKGRETFFEKKRFCLKRDFLGRNAHLHLSHQTNQNTHHKWKATSNKILHWPPSVAC